ncbi:MAG: pyridoxal phosphate-dependent aminotransferase [Tissierella sp.]|uniref:pyridoxal phosphate-dependent aminotransferase n=1 Tax=Tissierella sp. TaxID=41274 RepID=UPI003F980484
MEHGGDLITYENRYKGELVDFSSNINPLGIPNGLEEELIKGFATLNAYPDIQYRELKKEISNYLACEKGQVLVGNGAVEIINNFIIDSRSVVVFKPSFSEYEKRTLANGKQVRSLFYEDDFTIDLKKIENEIKNGDLLILGNPNNPTGLRIEEDTLIEIYNIIREKDAFLLLDEAFFEFSPTDYDSIELFKNYQYKNIGIIRAATKFFSLPGIRLGYGCTNPDKVERLRKVELPWSVNALANTAGLFIFRNKEFIIKSKEYIETERNFLLEGLDKIEGIKAFKTHTNYILIKLLNYSEEEFFKIFLKNGILIRKCSSFEGLNGDYIRIAIKDRANNERILDVFEKL